MTLGQISLNYLPDEDVLASVSLEIFILFERLIIMSDNINITVCRIFRLKQNTPFLHWNQWFYMLRY